MNTPKRQPLTELEVQTKPWKYIGYKTFSSWIASEDEFFVVRRFDGLNVRVLLKLQWEVSKVEKKLVELDATRSSRDNVDIDNGTFEDKDPERQKLIIQAHDALQKYNSFLAQYSSVKRLPQASTESIRNVENWFITYPDAIASQETSFVEHRDELINIIKKPRALLFRILDKFPNFLWGPLFERVPAKFADAKGKGQLEYFEYNPETTQYADDHRVGRFINTLILLIGFLMLVIPLWILRFTGNRTKQLGVITVCIAVFLCIIQSVTVPRPFETLAATAAYSAVLMVFLQIGGDGSGQQ